MTLCKFGGCYKERKFKDHFCDEHMVYDSLSEALFNAPLSGNGMYNMEPLTGVYVMGSYEVGAIKIGIARDVLDRLSTIQTGFPRPLRLFSVFYTSRKSAEQLERECHAKLTEFGFHLNGEWFDADPDDSIQLVKKCADSIGIVGLTPKEYSSLLGGDSGPMHDIVVARVINRIASDAIREMS